MEKKIYFDDDIDISEFWDGKEPPEEDVDFDDYPYWEEEEEIDEDVDEQVLEDLETDRRFQEEERRRAEKSFS